MLTRKSCTKCGKCIEACPVSYPGHQGSALSLPSRQVTVSALWQLLYPQLDLVRQIGGLTVSGGEALLQWEAVAALLRLCKDEGIHTAVETSGALPEKNIKAVAGLTDCWLYGLRPTPFYTPPHADRIILNLAFLSTTASRIIIRTPVMAGITDLSSSLSRIAGIMQENRLTEIQLLPFNRETSHYYNALGRTCRVGSEAIVTPGRLEMVRDFFTSKSFLASIIQ
jgi:pyruvate formate lyase activating enzyme